LWAPLRQRKEVLGQPLTAIVVCEPAQMHIRFRHHPSVEIRNRR
jgi:hypothetical protein